MKVWDYQRKGREATTFYTHEFGVASVAISPDGKHVASCSERAQLSPSAPLIVQDLETRRVVHRLGKSPRDVSFNYAGNLVSLDDGGLSSMRCRQAGNFLY